MEAESESTVSGYNAQIVDVNESQGILVLPGGKEIPVKDNPITVGRNDVSEYVEFKIGKNPNEVSSQQFTIWRVAVTSGESPYHYFIEDAKNSVQEKSSGNGTRVNDEKLPPKDVAKTVSSLISLTFPLSVSHPIFLVLCFWSIITYYL
jgi:hypothetical protein